MVARVQDCQILISPTKLLILRWLMKALGDQHLEALKRVKLAIVASNSNTRNLIYFNEACIYSIFQMPLLLVR